jgi:hypothetical protein
MPPAILNTQPISDASSPHSSNWTPGQTPLRQANWLISAPVAIVLFWLANVAFISVSGEFPLNDDWIYAEGVNHFLQTGELRLLACAPACIFHLVFGAAVCKVFGFSHVVLRCIGVFWALAGTLGLYGCMRELGLKRGIALLFALTFACNPMTVNLAFSFMTDTPAFSLFILYAFFTIRGIRRKSELNLFYATLALIAGSLVRQNLAMMAGANVLLLLGLWLCRRHSWTLLLGLVILPVATGIFADKWMLATSDFSALYLWYKGMVSSTVRDILHAPSKMFLPLTQIAGQLLCYIGLFCAPILICFHRHLLQVFLPLRNASAHKHGKPAQRETNRARWTTSSHSETSSASGAVANTDGRSSATQLDEAGTERGPVATSWYVIAASVMTYALTQYVVVAKKLMPFNQNLLRMPAVGAHTLLGINHPNLPNRFRSYLTGIGGILGVLLGALLGAGLERTLHLLARTVKQAITLKKTAAMPQIQRKILRASTVLFVFCLCAMQWAFVMLQSSFSDIDRYYLFPFVSSMLCLALVWRWLRINAHRATIFVSVAILAMYSIYSAAACQDLLAWNRARWDALASLEKGGVAPGEIDGGAEYNYYSNPQLFKHLKLQPTWYELTHRGDPPRDQWRWWSVDQEKYIVSFSPVPNYDVVDRRNYWSALAGNREILVLKRLEQ